MRVCESFKKVEMESVGEGAVEGGWWTGGRREEGGMGEGGLQGTLYLFLIDL